ncbi:MAG: nickel pincer cofactor biosynthesis protein LarB [bacterium]
MREEVLRELLARVAEGETGLDEAMEALRDLPFAEVGDFAVLDTHRALRCGFPEVILAEGKTPEQCAAIALRLTAGESPWLATRVDAVQAEAMTGAVAGAEHLERARAVRWLPVEGDRTPSAGPVAVVSAGTADEPVAEEAAVTLETMGLEARRMYDVGIAGLHRLLARRRELDRMAAVIVVAGMEGALPSVVGGLIRRPVIAVPTSVGYGAARGGYAALLGMLSSCASGVVVTNIDNGFGAAYAAARMVREWEGG